MKPRDRGEGRREQREDAASPRDGAASPREGRATFPIKSRGVAIRVLERVTEEGAYASAALDAELGRARLDPRDAGLATAIVYGTLRVLPELDRLIAARLHRPGSKLDPVLSAALRAGCYQLGYLERVPAHAVVDECVSAVRAARGPKLAAVANAVLRKLAVELSGQAGTRPGLVLPAWLDAQLERALTPERRAAWLRANDEPPGLCLRVAADVDRAAFADELRAARPDAEIELGVLSPRALLLRRAGDPRLLPGYADGRFSVQEEGAQLIAASLGAQPGERVADLCAGHGGKSVWLAEAVGASGQVLAVDVDERKLDKLGHELQRLQLADGRVQTRTIDLSVGSGGLGPELDRVLVDAPCSGLGTLRRRPELALRVAPEDPARLAALQLAILKSAARLVRPGGLLLLAVCSPLAVEGPELARQLERALPELVPCPELGAPPTGFQSDSDGVTRVGPWHQRGGAVSPDLYQLVAWRRPR
ncbi:MAG TPA: transcription antitermination factor NusB [Polyangiales bacterium]|nr:transcription antitermination factor NusB [Polyangiales bacterium]